MYEGKIATAFLAPLSAHGTFADEELTAFSWSDLVARLCAVQELRGALAHVPAAARASFDAMAAEHLANRREFAPHSGKPRVNLPLSGNGKEDSAKDGACADSAQPARRGIA